MNVMSDQGSRNYVDTLLGLLCNPTFTLIYTEFPIYCYTYIYIYTYMYAYIYVDIYMYVYMFIYV